MRRQIAIEEIHPNLRGVVKEFLLKCKYPFEMNLEGAYSTVDGVDYYTVVCFYDPMYPHLAVGALRWNVNYTGKASTFRVITRNVLKHCGMRTPSGAGRWTLLMRRRRLSYWWSMSRHLNFRRSHPRATTGWRGWSGIGVLSLPRMSSVCSAQTTPSYTRSSKT
jgi:hypothetical protein